MTTAYQAMLDRHEAEAKRIEPIVRQLVDAFDERPGIVTIQINGDAITVTRDDDEQETRKDHRG